MKVSLGMQLQDGPWGGGNQFGRALAAFLRERGAEVCFDLLAEDLDIALLTGSLYSATFSALDAFRYLRRNPAAIVLHRINECDERKGTRGVNRRLRRADLCADHTVFISSWLRDLLLEQGMRPSEHSVILNGADRSVFSAEGCRRWDGREPLRLVTHHWGGNALKGSDIYSRLDAMLAEPKWSERLRFTFVGNLPEGFTPRNAQHVAPLSGKELAAALRNHHVYLTGSQNEPAGMHHIEGACCGLPLLYRESGALPEYCKGVGIGFNAENFEQKLEEMIASYDHWAARMKDYPHTADRMCQEYYRLFQDLIARRDEIMRRRGVLRRIKWWLQGLR